MGSKARRTALSVAGLALAGGASLALAAPASAATPTDNEGAQSVNYSAGEQQSAAVSGTYTKVETTKVNFNTQSSSYAQVQGQNNAWVGGHDNGCASDCDDPHGGYYTQGAGYHYQSGGYRDGYHRTSSHTRVVGFYRTYQECRAAALRGGWDNYDCDFTRRGYRGWHQSWNKWGGNDWRCHGTWVLTAC
jgi:hypothetical protein